MIKFIAGLAPLFFTVGAHAATCFQASVTAREVFGAPAGADVRLVFMVPQRGDEIGKLTLMRGSKPVAETVVFHTPGEPVEYGLEGDHGSFFGTDHGRVLNLSLDNGVFAVGRDQDIVVKSAGVKGRVSHFTYTLQMMTAAECTRLYPDQGKVRFE